jgi:hypothetical protein
MPQPRETVHQQLKRLGSADTWGTKKEIKYLPEALDEDELILGICSGFYDGNTWLVTVTDQRILFLDKGMFFGLKQVEVRFPQITSVGHKMGLILAAIEVRTANGTMVIDNIQKSDAIKISGIVREQIAKREKSVTVSSPSAQPNSPIADLERLANLLQQGFISQEEFAQQKQRLLGLTAPSTPTPSPKTPQPPSAAAASQEPTVSEEETAAHHFAKAKEYVTAGQKDVAIAILKDIIKNFPRTQAAAKARRSLIPKSN